MFDERTNGEESYLERFDAQMRVDVIGQLNRRFEGSITIGT